MGYYQGDYYQGDPGFFSFLGKVAKSAVGLIPGVGPIASSLVGGAASLVSKKKPASSGLTAAGSAGLNVVGSMMKKSPALMAPGVMGVSRPGMGLVARTPRGMAAGGRKRRRMRVTNTKALRRAIRRAEGFAHLAKRVMRFTSPRAPRGRAVFKRRRRTKRV